MKTNHRKPYKVRNKYARSLHEDPQFRPKVVRAIRLKKPKKITVNEATRIKKEEE
jgi:hypothetical protein